MMLSGIVSRKERCSTTRNSAGLRRERIGQLDLLFTSSRFHSFVAPPQRHRSPMLLSHFRASDVPYQGVAFTLAR